MNREERVQKYLETVPALSKGILTKAFSGQGSPRQAIKAKCLDCSNYQRDEITECRVFTCPLWIWRPFQTKEDQEDSNV